MTCRFLFLCLLLTGIMSGCVTPAKRATAHAAAFHRLSAADQRLVLGGRVRPGLAHESVVIAWGEPDGKIVSGNPEGGKGTGPEQTWIYRRGLTIHLGIGSYDQWQPANSFAFRGIFSPGYGFGGAGNEGWLQSRPHVQSADSYVRRAVFVNGRLDTFSSWYGELPGLP